MRYNPIKDCSTYFEWPNPWDLKSWFCEPPKKKKKPKVHKEWEEKSNEGKQKTIPYWRDLEKIGKVITIKDLQFKEWPAHRREDPITTWLPSEHMYGGERFVKLTMGFPLGWKYRDAPINLSEVRKIQKAEEVRRKAELKRQKDLKKAEAGEAKEKNGKEKKNGKAKKNGKGKKK